MIFGKVYNARWSVERTKRDHAMRVDTGRLAEVSAQLQGLLPQIAAETSLESLRGLEASGATAYFGVLDEMILREKETFFFHERSRRPPLDARSPSLDARIAATQPHQPDRSATKQPRQPEEGVPVGGAWAQRSRAKRERKRLPLENV